jgi:integrase/recombinase XerC
VKLSDYLPFCYAMAGSDSTVALYHPYWVLLGEQLGDHELEDIKPGQIRMVAKLARDKQAAKRRVNHQNGLYAQEHLISAARALFRWAIEDELVTSNPALKVEKPKRPDVNRHALSHAQVRELFESCERDEDTVILRFFVETGCRREGLLNLRRQDVRPARQTVWLDEKNSARREQPVSQALMLALLSEDCPLYSLTRRQLDGLWTRVRRQVPWAKEMGVSSHWLRHYSITQVNHIAGYACAAAFAGHALTAGATASYVKVGLPEVAAAFSRLWGEPHPAASEGAARGAGPRAAAAGAA